jgi:polysaccharide pyruvyl transferase CsaB
MKEDKVKILVCGNYGIGNLGDEAILAGILRLLDSSFPGSKVTVMSSRPEITSKDARVEAIPYFPAGVRSWFKFIFFGEFLKVVGAVNRSDLIILGGGGLFADEIASAVWIWFVQAWWFYFLGKKVVCLGQSVGPLHRYWARKMTAWVFKKAALVTVRDEKSAVLLKDLGVKKIHVLADSAYAIGYDSESFHKRNGYIAMTLRQWAKGNLNEIDTSLADFVKWAWKEKKLKTFFIPFQNTVESDMKRFESLAKLVDNEKIFSLKTTEGDFREALEIISRADYVVGMRLHSIIFAVLCKRPFIALSYSTKVRDFVKTLGLANWIDYQEISLERLEAMFNEMEKNYNQTEKILETKKLHFTYEFFKHENLLREVLGK